MAAKRKDSRGRVLRTGESQRKDGLYCYRYTDASKTRRSIYASTLEELREKEDDVAFLRRDNISYTGGGITVNELLERYTALRRGVRHSTEVGYQFVKNLVAKQPFGQRKIRDVRVSDAKLWFIDLFEQGYSYGSIASVRGVVKPAFQMAVADDILRKNPFDFRLDIIPNNTRKRIALTEQQQKDLLDFIAGDAVYSKYLDMIVVMLGTGMRVSELCGLTISDLDFENRRIRVERQLVKQTGGVYHVEKTKTESGRRYIPMSDDVCRSLYNILADRPKCRQEVMVDGHTGFLLLGKDGKPKVAHHISHVVQRLREKYNREHVIPMPLITPHVFRHTFCTNMANAGMDLKNLQYLMGHSDAGVTMNVYTHNSYETAEESMSRIVPFSKAALPPDRQQVAK